MTHSRNRLIFSFLMAGAFIALCLSFTTRQSAAPVTYSKDVAPILHARCAACHRAGEAAPMSLLNYKEVRPWAKSIRETVVKREMPPWYADPQHGEFANDRRLAQQELDAIVAWVDGGAKEGDPKDMPPAPKFSDTGWKFGQPDVVLPMTEEVSIPADGTVPYRWFAVPTNFTEDKYVQSAEIKRGEPRVVHHVIIFVREPGQGPPLTPGEVKPERLRGNPEAGQQSQRQQQPRNNNPDAQMVGWAPGMEPLTLKSGQAKLVKKGSLLLFQMHYTTNGIAAKDRTAVGLWFAKAPVEKQMITRGLFVDPNKLVIPAGDANFESRSSHTFTDDVHVQMFMPHMHVRGKDFEYKLVYPDGTSKILLRVPKYDFNWQLAYFPKEPIAVPKGSRIECLAHHDNSVGNKFNPDPTITVRWGDQTWEEMMIGWLDYTLDGQNLRAAQAASR